ncbi:NAD(P)-binding protein [Dentipellis sp. KUC8613]|nr:NAD(P)-binding protein [Dentipellis sp. KUC8613]
MSSTKTQVLITGATGYIGGTVLQLLLAHPKRDTFDITAYVRSEYKAKKLRDLGVRTATGTLDEGNKLKDAASKADVIFNIADSDNLEATKALLSGLRKRFETTGEPPILIHTSGTGIFMDNTQGESTDVIYYDTNIAQIEALPDTALHRNVDLEVVAADEAGYARTYIVLPGTVYGLASGTLVDLCIMNRHSIQIPFLIKSSLDRGHAGVIGEGRNIWPHSHVDDVAQMFITVFDAVLGSKGQSVAHGREGFYYVENGEYELMDVSKEVAKVFYDLGIQKTPDIKPFTEEEKAKYGVTFLGFNSRGRGDRSRALGWKATKTKEDFVASIRPEVESLVAELKK